MGDDNPARTEAPFTMLLVRIYVIVLCSQGLLTVLCRMQMMRSGRSMSSARLDEKLLLVV